MVDPDRLRSLLGRLAERRADLDRYAGTAASAYLEDGETVAASKYRLLTAVEDALAIANHVIGRSTRSSVPAGGPGRLRRVHQGHSPGVSGRVARTLTKTP